MPASEAEVPELLDGYLAEGRANARGQSRHVPVFIQRGFPKNCPTRCPTLSESLLSTWKGALSRT